ncbi:MAG TPA: hypothetical protein ENK39_08730 [Epsilonproteobacteria bacterium]|nr:hypothetical protein [Campylobacterota bacterium]
MKIILLILSTITIFLSFLPAQELEDFAMVSIYQENGKSIVYESNNTNSFFRDINVTFSMLKSNDMAITLANIKDYDKKFIPVPKTELFQDTNTTYWLRVDLGSSFPSGRFVYAYADADFSEYTILPRQQLEKFTIDGLKHMKFTYTRGLDSQVYYFKLVPKHYRIPLTFLNVLTPQTFYNNLVQTSHMYLFLGVLLGLILMAGIYNAAMYYYNKDISFLYYALLQLFMLLILYDFSATFMWDENSFLCRNIKYEYITSLFTTLFATLFTDRFLELKIHLPKLHKIMQIVIVAVVIDMGLSLIYESIILEYQLLPWLMLFFIYGGYRRVRQGYKPARFYLAGWTILSMTVFLNIFNIGGSYLPLDPLYIGATLEAILFSLALSYKMRMVAKEKEEQKELLIHQSKLASMGEMIGNIAHQWRQPLTHLGYIFMNIKEAQKYHVLNETYINKKLEDAEFQLEFMSQTIDDFKNFYAPNKEKENFTLSSATEETLEIIKNTLKHNDIEVELIIKEDTALYNYKNEYKQVLLNIISNAKDALIERVSISPKIIITLDKNTTVIEDNAGGINEEILERIYEPYFTTKEGNSGIGLYMSKMIIERNMGGKLSVINTEKGAKFTLNFT